MPQLRMFARMRTNRPLTPLESVEQAKADPFDAMADSLMAASRAKWLVGTGDSVRSELAAFASRYGVDEVMISPVAGVYDGEPADRSTGRIQTLELLGAHAPVAA